MHAGLSLAAGAGAALALVAAVFALWLALWIDLRWGEPPARFHPVVWIGRFLGWIGRRIAPPAGPVPAPRFTAFAAGALAWWLGAAVVVAAALAVVALAQRLPVWLAWLLTGVALKPLLAWRMLRDEVLLVEATLGISLDAGRSQLARLVSRDTSALSEAGLRESAIESLAENLNDSVVAPVFWFMLLGLPGAALYRFANTADAMWGYHGERNGRDWEWAGKWAARADDLLSWLPARITALLLACAALIWRTRMDGVRPGPRFLRAVRREARRTPSPNSGWPMAAMALLLGVRLGKPGVYLLHAGGRSARAADMWTATALAARAVAVLAALAGLAASAGIVFLFIRTA